MQRFSVLSTIVLVTMLSACASRPTVRVPPRVDLRQHELIGVIDFSAAGESELGVLATQRFTEEARRDQGMVRMLALGSEESTLNSVGHQSMESEAYEAIGRERGVQTILVGELTVSNVRPNLKVAFDSGSLSAQIDATLVVQMIETSTGASIWSRSASATQSVGHVSVFGGGDVVLDAEDPERAYGGLVDTLVAQVTRDFHVTWRRQ